MNDPITKENKKAIKDRVKLMIAERDKLVKENDQKTKRHYIRTYTRMLLFQDLGIEDLYFYYNYITTKRPREDYKYKSARYYKLCKTLGLINEI